MWTFLVVCKELEHSILWKGVGISGADPFYLGMDAIFILEILSMQTLFFHFWPCIAMLYKMDEFFCSFPVDTKNIVKSQCLFFKKRMQFSHIPYSQNPIDCPWNISWWPIFSLDNFSALKCLYCQDGQIKVSLNV